MSAAPTHADANDDDAIRRRVDVIVKDMRILEEGGGSFESIALLAAEADRLTRKRLRLPPRGER